MHRQLFYRSNLLTHYDNKNVIYIAYVGKYNSKETFKYGKSTNVFNREMLSHRKNFDTFEMQHIYKTDLNDYVENMLEKELKIRDIHTNLKINDKNQTELFFETNDYSLTYIDRLVKDIIKDINSTQKNTYLLEREKLKVKKMQIQLKMKELDYKIKNIPKM